MSTITFPTQFTLSEPVREHLGIYRIFRAKDLNQTDKYIYKELVYFGHAPELRMDELILHDKACKKLVRCCGTWSDFEQIALKLHNLQYITIYINESETENV